MDLEFYKKFIFRIASEYKFLKINKDILSKKIKETKDKICFMRHDIDFSPENALKIAEIEYQKNISSTFTVCTLDAPKNLMITLLDFTSLLTIVNVTL